MVKITDYELVEIYGGGKKGVWATIGVIVGVVGTLIAGIIDGYLRPLGCNR